MIADWVIQRMSIFFDVMEWDWSKLITSFVGAGFGTAAIQAVIPFVRDRRDRRAHAAYLAMRLAVILESFASSCENLISDNSNAEVDTSDGEPMWNVTLPDLSAIPDDIEGWRALDRSLASRCLNFRNKIVASQRIIESTIEFSRDDLDITLTQDGAGRGLEAWNLATELRRKHDVGEVDTIWPYADSLKLALEQANKASNERRAASRDFFEQHFTQSKPSS